MDLGIAGSNPVIHPLFPSIRGSRCSSHSGSEPTGDVVYTRIMRTYSDEPQGCRPEVFPQLAASARAWAEGGEPEGVPRIEPAPQEKAAARDVFVFFISGAKERAPAAAMALRLALGEEVAPTGGHMR